MGIILKVLTRQKMKRTQSNPAATASLLQEGTHSVNQILDVKDSGTPSIFIWDRSGVVPQLVAIDTVCEMLSLRKSAVYALVAKGLLEPPCKLTPGRRGASRWLISSIFKFIQALADQRTLPTALATTTINTESGPKHANALTTSKVTQARSPRSTAGSVS